MTEAAETTNPHEVQARARKVQALTSWLVATMGRMGITRTEAVDAAVRFCDRATVAAWEQAAQECGVNVPSVQTQEQVRSTLEGMRDAAPAAAFAGLPGN